MSLKVFYLDDEPDLAEIFLDYFSAPGVEIFTYTDPQKALAEFAVVKPDLVFLDFRLPGTTGDEIAQKLPLDVPKYLVTGDLSVDTKYQFKGVLNKPVNVMNVQSIIDSFKKAV